MIVIRGDSRRFLGFGQPSALGTVMFWPPDFPDYPHCRSAPIAPGYLDEPAGFVDELSSLRPAASSPGCFLTIAIQSVTPAGLPVDSNTP